MFVSRSSLEKPSPFERWVRTTSPSRYSTSAPLRSSSPPTSSAIVDFPAPESPVNQSVNPVALLSFRFGRPVLTDGCVEVNPAFELVRAGPAAGALLLARRGRPGARNAADRAVAGLVQRVEGDLVDLGVGPAPPLVPVGERVQLPDAVALRPLQLRGGRAARRLVAPDSGDPPLVGPKRLEQRLDLADVAAAIGIGLPQVRPLAPVLLGDREHVRAAQLQSVPLDEPVAGLV